MILCPKGPYFNSAKCQQQQLLLVLHAAATEDAGNLGEKRGQLEVFYTHRPFRHIALCVAPAAAVLRVQLCSHLSLCLLDERRLVRRRGSLIAAKGKKEKNDDFPNWEKKKQINYVRSF